MCFWIINSSLAFEPRNPELEKTGAPGELTCEKSGCHSGGKFVGTINISGIPDTVIANTKYDLTITHKSNAVITGFQLTCLDTLNKKCGTLTSGQGSNVGTGATFGRQYIRQSNAKQLVDSTASWNFSWTAPAAITGNTITFYFSSLCGSNTQGEKGDNAIKNTKRVTFMLPSSISNELLDRVEIYPNPAKDYFILKGDKIKNLDINIFDIGGRLMQHNIGSNHSKINISELETGIYTVLIQSGKDKIIRKLIKE